MYQVALTCGIIACISITSLNGQEALPPPVGWHVPEPVVTTPGADFKPPVDNSLVPSKEVPLIYEHSGDAGPDQTFFAVGHELSGELFVWGQDSESLQGRRWDAKAQLVNNNYLAATLPERSFDSMFIVWVKNQAG